MFEFKNEMFAVINLSFFPSYNLLVDVFISYRVNSDADLAEKLYNALKDLKFNVFLDKFDLTPGVPWEKGFCNGLASSRMFVPILSRNAINNSNDSRANFSTLNVDSPSDNVLLEYRLALELKDRNLILRVHPLFVGDLVDDVASGGKVYRDYFKFGCHPNAPDVSIASVEEKVKWHLEDQKLGNPIKPSRTVKEVLNEISSNQGFIFEGTDAYCVTEVTRKVLHMKKDVDRSVTVLVQTLFAKFCDCFLRNKVSQQEEVEEGDVEARKACRLNCFSHDRKLVHPIDEFTLS
jgi:hypothetical protein